MLRAALIALLLTAGACAAKEAPVNDSPGHSPPFPAPRDGQVAVQEEFDAAMAADTVAAWDLFIRRHPDNPLTERAMAYRGVLLDRARLERR